MDKHYDTLIHPLMKVVDVSFSSFYLNSYLLCSINDFFSIISIFPAHTSQSPRLLGWRQKGRKGTKNGNIQQMEKTSREERKDRTRDYIELNNPTGTLLFLLPSFPPSHSSLSLPLPPFNHLLPSILSLLSIAPSSRHFLLRSNTPPLSITMRTLIIQPSQTVSISLLL